MAIETPQGWGQDPLSSFFATAMKQQFATFAQERAWFTRLRDIDGTFRHSIDHLKNPKPFTPALFLLRTHCSFLVSASLASSALAAEGFIVLRGCLESALYAHHIHKVPSSELVWLRRQDSQQAERAVRREFAIGPIKAELRANDARLGRIVDEMYERTLSFGGHPNAMSLLQSLEKTEDPSDVTFSLQYIHGGSLQMVHILKTTAQIGVCTLMIYNAIFRTRFKLLGLDRRIESLGTGL